MLLTYTPAWQPASTPERIRQALQDSEQAPQNAVFLDRADYSGHGLAHFELRDILLPCAEQLLVAQGYPAVGVDALDDGVNALPAVNLADGCGILDTEMPSIGMRALMPAPISQNTPKPSIWETVAGITSPGRRVEIYSSAHSCCTLRRLSRA